MTIFEVEESLLENADFEEVGSVAKAKAFVTAARRWLVLKPQSASNQSSSMSMNAQQVADMMNAAQAFVDANDSSRSNVRFLSVLQGFR